MRPDLNLNPNASTRYSDGLLVILALAALGIYLFMAHTGHVLSALPYLLLLACLLMHLFMHHGPRHDARRDG
nr:DUF2933 domain-containing protein [Methylobacterium nodulans]